MSLVNARDGGINGVKLVWEECETEYNNARGVECYERLKTKGPTGNTVVHPLSTGITYSLIDKATADKIPIISLGYGRTDATDGSVFPYVFPLVTNYWSQNTAKIKFIGMKEGGMDKLKGKKIVNIYHDSAYGKETIPVLDVQAKKYGFSVTHVPVAHPGNEEDTIPAGSAAKGFIAAGFNVAGANYPVIKDIQKFVYAKGNGNMEDKSRVGSVYYNRGVVHGILTVEAIRTAQEKFGKGKPITGEQMRWGIEHLNVDAKKLKALGAEGFMPDLKVTCSDHEGSGKVKFQQWDGKKWNVITDWIDADQSIVRPMIEESAAKYAKEKGIKPRDCSKES
jgi:branched-chain amino acid transport system substrate-binding protein